MARGREPDHRSIDFSSRERDRSPMMRNIDDLTSDPNTATSRIFLGILSPNIDRFMLENHFSRWGNIVGVTLTKNRFGFVQFEKETEAQACLASGPSIMLNGERLDIKPARVGMGQAAAPPPVPGLGNNVLKLGPSGYGVGGGVDGMWGPRNSYDGNSDPSPRNDPHYSSYYSSSGSGKGRESEGRLYDEYYRDYYDRPLGGGSSSGGGTASVNYYREELEPRPPPTRSYESPSYSYPSDPLDPLDPMRPNDVEIVVPNKAQRAFAESIEAQLKRMNLLVDLLFPPPDITPTRVLNDLADRHCLYAIFATAENEKHSSLTLNILHGEPQEHRNMPVEDALRLMQRNFEDYVKQTRLRNMRQVVPRDIRNLLLDLLEMRSLSMGDLDKLIKYLRERQNALVDHQIEQKREIAETQSSLVAGSMAVTYPGYNYIASTVPGAVTDTSPASVAAAAVAAAAPQGIIAGGAGAPPGVAHTPASMNIVSSPSAAAAIAAYPATAYTTTGIIGAYGVTPQSQASHQIMTAPPPVVAAPTHPPPSASKQADLQERILNLMKGQAGITQGGLPVVSGVPTGVPPPTVVQQHPPQHGVPPMWMQHSAPHPDNTDKIQGSQHAYNPWG